MEFGHVTAAIEGSTFQFSYLQFDCRVAPEMISGIPSSIYTVRLLEYALE